MEMLDGEPLSARLRRGPMPWREAVAIGAEVGDALATAHEHGVVHRDVSPDNVMLTSSGLRVFDFGIAAAVGEPDDDATGSTFGTPAYVAPERLDGQPAHTATDVYCLGVLLFEMLTGAPPFPEDTWDPEAPLRERPLPRPRGVSGLPSAVARLCQRCLAFDPAARPPAREVAIRLAVYARPRWRAPAAIAAGAVAVLATAAVAFATPPGERPAGVGAVPAPASSTSDSSTSTSPAPLIVPDTTTAAAPAPTTAPPAPPAATTPSASTPAPVTPAVLPVGQALTSLRGTINDAVATGDLAEDIAQDLRNSVDNIDRKWLLEPTADLTPMVDGLRSQVINRSQGLDANGNLRMTVSARDALLASIAQLRTSATAAAA
jgi:serine/threonine-protein kinase